MLVEVTYSTKDYEKARKYNVKMALKKGKADKVFEYEEKDIDQDFREKNAKTLSCKRGGGYWLWKPYVVNKTLKQIEYGDYLFYCDSGAFIKKDIHPLIWQLENAKTDLLCFNIDLIEKIYTKRDVFIALDGDKNEIYETNQRCATYFLIKKTDRTVAFVNEWLNFAQQYELISDEPNVIYKKENYDGFKDNRHDQSIFSVLTKKYGYDSQADISQYRYPIGKANRKNIDTSNIFICLHRQKKADFTMCLREKMVTNYPNLRRYFYYGYS